MKIIFSLILCSFSMVYSSNEPSRVLKGLALENYIAQLNTKPLTELTRIETQYLLADSVNRRNDYHRMTPEQQKEADEILYKKNAERLAQQRRDAGKRD